MAGLFVSFLLTARSRTRFLCLGVVLRSGLHFVVLRYALRCVVLRCVLLCVPAGPGAAQQLVDTTKGYALLLKKGKEPLTAGLLDVYGRVSTARLTPAPNKLLLGVLLGVLYGVLYVAA